MRNICFCPVGSRLVLAGVDNILVDTIVSLVLHLLPLGCYS